MVAFKLYQIYYDDAAARLVRKNIITDLKVIDFSDLDQSLELEAGRFQIGNASVTVSGLSRTWMTDMSPEEPWVMEVHDNDQLVWHGMVVPQTARYSLRTELTSFDVASWEYLLAEAGSTAARSIYETDLLQTSFAEGGFANLYFADFVPIQAGDVIKVDGKYKEGRFPVLNVTVQANGTKAAAIQIETQQTIFKDKTNGTGYPAYFEVTDAEVYSKLSDVFPPTALQKGFGPIHKPTDLYLDLTIGSRVLIRVKTLQFVGNDTLRMWTDGELPVGAASNWSLHDRQDQYELQEEGTSVEILGRDLYGYSGTVPRSYETLEVIKQIFTNPALEFGILHHITDTVSVTGAAHLGTLDRWIELSDDPLAALRQLQLVSKSFLKVKPKIVNNGYEDIPRVDVEIIRRKGLTDTSVASKNVVDWTEDVTPRTIKAVVVKANEDYKKPKNDLDYVGFFYKGINSEDQTRRNRLGVPSGPGVIEIEIPVTPSYTGYSYGGENGPIVNDERLKEIAEFYYEFYTIAAAGGKGRPMDGEIAVRNPDLVGKYVTFTESSLNDSVLVLTTSTSLRGNEARTSFSGHIGDFVAPTPTAPTAIITGRTVYRDLDGTGNETVYFSAANSYDNDDGELTFEWSLDNFATVFSTEPFIEPSLANGGHTIYLRVTNSVTGLTDTTSVGITITGYTETTTPEMPAPNFEWITLNVNAAGEPFLNFSGNSDVQSIKMEYRVNSSSTFAELRETTSYAGNPLADWGIFNRTALNTGETIYVTVTVYSGPNQTDESLEWSGHVANTTPTSNSIVVSMLAKNAKDYVAEPSTSTGSVAEPIDNDSNTIKFHPFTLKSLDGTVNVTVNTFATDSPRSVTGFPASGMNLDVYNPLTYFYVDLADSNYLKRTTTYADLNNNDHILVAISRPDNSSDPFSAFIVTISGESYIDAIHINVARLSALAATMGSLSIDNTLTITSGNIVAGTTSNGVVINSNGVRGLSGGLVQAEMRASDGRIVAGASDGNGRHPVTLHRNGITLEGGSFTPIVWEYNGSKKGQIYTTSSTFAVDSENANLQLSRVGGGRITIGDPWIHIIADGYAEVYLSRWLRMPVSDSANLPGTPATWTATIYFDVDAGGVTRLMAKFNNGVTKVIATDA